MITREEIKEALDNLDQFEFYAPEDYFWKKGSQGTSNGILFELETSYNDLDDTDHKYVVVKVTKEDESVFIKFEGYYNSYEGTEWNGLFHIVERKEVVKTVWEKT